MQYNVLIHLVQCMYGIIVRSQGLWTEPRAGFVTRDSGELGIKQCQRRGNDRESIGITTFVSTRTGLQNAFKPFAGEPRASFAGEAVVTRASSRWRRMGFSSPCVAVYPTPAEHVKTVDVVPKSRMPVVPYSRGLTGASTFLVLCPS
jgi:hypothetical protein